VLFLSDWNWIGAERSLERAIELDPDNTDAYLLYGRLLEALGHVERGLAAKQKALERNPRSALVHVQIAHSYWNKRQYDLVIEWANKALALDPGHLLAREYIAAAYLLKGDLDRHFDETVRQAECYGVPAETVDDLRRRYAAGGRPALVDYVIRKTSAQGGSPVQLALLFGEAGRVDEAFRQLDLAIECHDPSLVHLAVSPQWDVLRADPRFQDRLARMGLPAGGGARFR
jgi:tetratricopeptide (TPR) repeat protein